MYVDIPHPDLKGQLSPCILLAHRFPIPAADGSGFRWPVLPPNKGFPPILVVVVVVVITVVRALVEMLVCGCWLLCGPS